MIKLVSMSYASFLETFQSVENWSARVVGADGTKVVCMLVACHAFHAVGYKQDRRRKQHDEDAGEDA